MSGSVTSSADPGPAGASGPASASAAITHAMNDFMPSSFELVGEWPEPKIVLQRLPEPGESERLDDEEEEDQAAEDPDLGGDVAVADRHPRPSHARPHEVLREHGQHDHGRQAEEVLPGPGIERYPQQREVGDVDRRVHAAADPADVGDAPLDDVLDGEG